MATTGKADTPGVLASSAEDILALCLLAGGPAACSSEAAGEGDESVAMDAAAVISYTCSAGGRGPICFTGSEFRMAATRGHL